MNGTDILSLDQQKCKVCSTIIEDWRNIWDVDVSPQDQVVRIVCNEELLFHTYKKKTENYFPSHLYLMIAIY